MPPYYRKQPLVSDLFNEGPTPDRRIHPRRKGLVKKIRYLLSMLPAL